jgi:hypothetical protein
MFVDAAPTLSEYDGVVLEQLLTGSSVSQVEEISAAISKSLLL